MAEKGTFHVDVDNDLKGCAILLKSVACEWVLILFLFVDSVFLYILTKFAKYCNLQLPCMICSRIDHILGNEKPDFYKNLICNDHRSKLSSLIFCHSHGSLANVRDVCEECLLSFAAKKDSSPEIYKFLIGKLGLDGLKNPVSEMDFFHGFVSMNSCSCCNKQYRCRPNVQKLMKSRSFGSRASKPDNIPLPSAPSQKYLNRRDPVKTRDRISVTTSPLFLGFPEGDSLSPMGYTKLKISESEELLFSEDDDGGSEHNDYNQQDHIDQQNPKFPFKAQVSSPTNTASYIRRPQASPKYSAAQPELSPRSVSYSSSPRCHVPTSRDIMESPGTPRTKLDQSKEDDKVKGDAETWDAFDLVSPKNGRADLEIDEDKKDGITLPNFHARYIRTTNHLDATNSMDEASRLPSEQLARKDHSEINKRANVSSPQASLSDDKDDSPFSFKVNGYADDSSKDIVKQNCPSLEMSESNLSLGEYCVNKVEGESLIAQLRRQIDENTQCIDTLCKELEEERSASAEAANQAMAMITKLQEEKAVLNMDSQQYLRMMEEQAEHDLYALEKANDLLAEKEKEIQDLEAELEFYRLKYPDEYEQEFMGQGFGMIGGKSIGFDGFHTAFKENKVAQSPKKY